MAASTAKSKPSPERIFNTMVAFQETEALKAAIELDIFTAIAEGANTAESLAGKTGTSERGMRILCDYFTVKEFLTKTNNQYSLTEDAATFLLRHSPACLASIIHFLASPRPRKHFAALADASGRGGTAGAPGDGPEPQEEVGVDSARR